jgi:hypothetical protein
MALNHSAQQVFLVFEMQVECFLGNPQLTGHIVHVYALDSVAHEDVHSTFYQLLFFIGRHFGARKYDR